MKIFITGGTGFIGGSVAVECVRRGHTVRALTRSPDKASYLSSFGIDPVIGDLSDLDLLSEEAVKADAVINAADSDNRSAVDAFLNTLSGTGKAFLHTSGTSVIADLAGGEPSDYIYDDNSLPAPVPDKIARAELDRSIVSSQGIRSIVLCNSLIFGDAIGPQAQSVQLPLLIADAQSTGCAHYIGRGLNRWSTVHISDVVDLYLLALERAPAGTFAFVESGEAAFQDMARAIGHSLGLGEPESITVQDAEMRWGRQRARYSLGSNSRVRSKRARELGWMPKRLNVMEWINQHLSHLYRIS
jgi:nucleoside-diphosphate-sugar epimerase